MRGKDQEKDDTRFTDNPFLVHMLADLLDKVRNMTLSQSSLCLYSRCIRHCFLTPGLPDPGTVKVQAVYFLAK